MRNVKRIAKMTKKIFCDKNGYCVKCVEEWPMHSGVERGKRTHFKQVEMEM